jgi:hypothetical protein
MSRYPIGTFAEYRYSGDSEMNVRFHIDKERDRIRRLLPTHLLDRLFTDSDVSRSTRQYGD